MKHTPGPWIIDPANKGMVCKEINSIYEYICDCELEYSDLFTQEEEQANARLIAAVPDLLEACELALKYLYKASADGMETAIPVKNAIRTVEGAITKTKKEGKP